MIKINFLYVENFLHKTNGLILIIVIMVLIINNKLKKIKRYLIRNLI